MNWNEFNMDCIYFSIRLQYDNYFQQSLFASVAFLNEVYIGTVCVGAYLISCLFLRMIFFIGLVLIDTFNEPWCGHRLLEHLCKYTFYY